MSAQTGKRRTLPARELNILSKLSTHVSDAEQSAQLISLLLPFLARKLIRDASVEVNILHTIQHLLRQVQEPEGFLE